MPSPASVAAPWHWAQFASESPASIEVCTVTPNLPHHCPLAPSPGSLPAASYFPEFKESAIAMIRAQGGIVGWTADTAAVEAALAAA